LQVTRPSEPSDILWENTDTFGLALYMRRALSMVCMCAIFAVGAGLQVTFEQVKQATREDEADIYGEPKTLEEDAAVYLYLKALSALAAGTVVAINFVVTLSLKYLNNLERHRTHSSLESWYDALLSMLDVLSLSVLSPFRCCSARTDANPSPQSPSRPLPPVCSQTPLMWLRREPCRSINKLIVAHIINAAFVPIFVQARQAPESYTHNPIESWTPLHRRSSLRLTHAIDPACHARRMQRICRLQAAHRAYRHL
jgi:hypothetical protein